MIKKCDTSSFCVSNSLKRIISQNFWKVPLTIVIPPVLCSESSFEDPGFCRKVKGTVEDWQLFNGGHKASCLFNQVLAMFLRSLSLIILGFRTIKILSIIHIKIKTKNCFLTIIRGFCVLSIYGENIDCD